MLVGEDRMCSSIVGRADAVLGLWSRLGGQWGPARDVRPNQPLLATDTSPLTPPDPQVRLVRPSELDLLYPAAIAMYTEEVGVSPLADNGGRAYRRRVAQIQGVWVTPEWRGRGIATAAVAAVVHDALTRVAPTVSLYVNDFNIPARRVYARCGFRPYGALATVLF
jgi:predicted GNAT family acetyltransferase